MDFFQVSNRHISRIIWSSHTDCIDYVDCDGGGSGNSACSRSNIALLSRPDTTIPLWESPPNLYFDSLPNDNLLVFHSFGSSPVVVLNQPAQNVLETFSSPQPIANTTAYLLASLGLITPCGVTPTPPPSMVNTLAAWLHMTNACNLRCTYCYLNKTEESMEETTGRATVEAIFRSAMQYGFRAVSLKYAGGEATLNFPLVQTLHEHARRLADETGLDLQETVLSNGVTLTYDMLDYIRDTGMHIMISLDGIGAAHDAQRIFANGRGSFIQVERGIERAIRRGVQPHLSITVTGQSADRVAEAVTFALDHDLLFNLNFYRDNDYAKNRITLLAEDECLIMGIRAAFAVIEARLPRQSLIAALVDRANFGGLHTHTCGAGHNYMVVDQRGRVARCHMEIERTVTDVFDPDPLAVVRSTPHGFQNISVDEKEGCRDCSWRYWCAGGCPLLTYRVTGRSDVKSPYCNVYKALYPELLRLEGLRLLKWHNQAN